MTGPRPALAIERLALPSDRDRRWFLVAAAAIYVAVVALRWAIPDPDVPIAALWFAPVALAALGGGFRAALVAALAGGAANAVFLATDGPADLGAGLIVLRAAGLVIPWAVFGWVVEALAHTYRERLRGVHELERAHEDLGRRARELEHANAELARSNGDLERFAYVASHDLSEPLRIVAGYAELLERRAGDRLSEQERGWLARMTEGTDRLQQLIDDVLTWSRTGSRPLELDRVEIRAVVEDAVRRLAAAVEETGATIEVRDLPVVRGDAGQLRQLFQNLIGNALKFRGEAAPHVVIDAGATGDGWRFAVQDNGIGIDPAGRRRVFEMFERLHTNAEYPGTGVGLSICATVVQRHGGEIWVEETPGGGSTFCFTLGAPALADPADAVPPLPESSPAP